MWQGPNTWWDVRHNSFTVCSERVATLSEHMTSDSLTEHILNHDILILLRYIWNKFRNRFLVQLCKVSIVNTSKITSIVNTSKNTKVFNHNSTKHSLLLISTLCNIKRLASIGFLVHRETLITVHCVQAVRVLDDVTMPLATGFVKLSLNTRLRVSWWESWFPNPNCRSNFKLWDFHSWASWNTRGVRPSVWSASHVQWKCFSYCVLLLSVLLPLSGDVARIFCQRMQMSELHVLPQNIQFLAPLGWNL